MILGLGDFGFLGLGLDNDIFAEDGGLIQVLPPPEIFDGQAGGTILKLSYFLNFFVGPLLHA